MMKKFPYIPLTFFVGAAIIGTIKGSVGPVQISGLAFLWFGLGMIFLLGHFKNDLLVTAESILGRYLDAIKEGRERADAELLSRSEAEVEVRKNQYPDRLGGKLHNKE